MYPQKEQITISEFLFPYGTLDQNNRWVKKASLIPWQTFEGKYASLFSESSGAPAKPFRMALGALIIQQEMKVSDEETVQQIVENPYLQFFIGLYEYTSEPPFAPTMMVYFRKRITPEIIAEINDFLFSKPKDPKEPPNGGEPSVPVKAGEAKMPQNNGCLMLDATCTPANITYPTDAGLLNEAREKLEGIIDTLHLHNGGKTKPRTYRQTARQKFLRFARNRKPTKKLIRKAIGQQLRYVARDLKHVEGLLKTVRTDTLSNYQRKCLETIKKLYEQQSAMYKNKTHSIGERIVSISQPHVRPIVRGKVNASVEFGAKIAISLIDGYAYIDKLSWDAYNEESRLIPAIETYRRKYGCYPQAVLADKIYRNRDNLAFCRSHGIRLSGPRLGRPPKETDKVVLRQQKQDSAQRNAVEGKFGEGKTRYGLARIMARLQPTAVTVIHVAFFCMNLNRRLRDFLLILLDAFFETPTGLVFIN